MQHDLRLRAAASAIYDNVYPPRNLVGKSGLYRAVLNGETRVIGKSSGGGGSDLKRRIADFTRPRPSAPHYEADQFLNAD